MTNLYARLTALINKSVMLALLLAPRGRDRDRDRCDKLMLLCYQSGTIPPFRHDDTCPIQMTVARRFIMLFFAVVAGQLLLVLVWLVIGSGIGEEWREGYLAVS